MHISIDGAVTAASGVLSSFLRTAHLNTDAQSDSDYITDAFGWKEVWIIPSLAIASGAPLLFGASEVQNDFGDIETELAGLDSDIVTPGATPERNNVSSIPSDLKGVAVIRWDGINRIKTVALMMAAASANNPCTLTVVK